MEEGPRQWGYDLVNRSVGGVIVFVKGGRYGSEWDPKLLRELEVAQANFRVLIDPPSWLTGKCSFCGRPHPCTHTD